MSRLLASRVVYRVIARRRWRDPVRRRGRHVGPGGRVERDGVRRDRAAEELGRHQADQAAGGDGKIRDGNVTSPKLAGNAVTSAKVSDRGIGRVDLRRDAVGRDQLAEGAVGAEELADGSITT